jgi:hypothetical protein
MRFRFSARRVVQDSAVRCWVLFTIAFSSQPLPCGFGFDFVAVCALGVHPFQVWVDDPVIPGHHVPARLQLPSRVGDGRGEYLSGSWHLCMRHELSLHGGQVIGEIVWEVRGIKQEKPIRCLDQGLAVVRKFLAIARLGLALIRRVRRDVDKRGHFGVCTRFGDNGAAMRDARVGRLNG